MTMRLQTMSGIVGSHRLTSDQGSARNQTLGARTMTDGGFCSGCGATHPSGARFCASCGQALVATASNAGPVGQVPSNAVSTTVEARANRPRRRGPFWRLLVGVLLLLIVAAGVAGLASLVKAPPTAAGPAPNPLAEVTYTLTGRTTGASITYTDGAGNIQQQTNIKVPLVRKSGGTGIVFHAAHGAFVSFSAQNNGASGDLTCSIESDGVVINTGRASGGYAIVSCSGQVP
jgi:hypothetical protein